MLNIFVVLEWRGGNVFNVIQFTKFLNVTFYFAVSRARILGDRDVLVQVGSDINLTCRAEESPDVPETVTWYKNEQRVDNLLARGGISVVTESRRRSSNLLVSKVIKVISLNVVQNCLIWIVFFQVTKEDAGNYTCVPSNARADSVMVHVIDGKLGCHLAKNANNHLTGYFRVISSHRKVGERKTMRRG